MFRRIGVASNLTARGNAVPRPVQAAPFAQEISGNTQNSAPPIPSKSITSKILSPVNASTSTLASTGPANVLSQANQAQVFSPTTTTLDNRNQPILSPGSSHEGTTSDLAPRQGQADEFGYRQGDIIAATAPARIGQRPLSTSDSDDRRSEHLGDGSLSGGSLNRRTKSAAAAAARLKVVNPDQNIPEEPLTNVAGTNHPPSLNRWPTAEAEKERLYENAKARVAQVQNTAFEPVRILFYFLWGRK